MSLPAPADDTQPASYAETFDGSADIDLTARFAEVPWPASEVIVTCITAAAGAGDDLVVRFAGNPAVDVAIRIAPQNTMWIRGQFSSIRAASGADIRATFLWQAGPR